MDKTNLTHLGLFEGLGGFSIAAKHMEWQTIAWCEINPFCEKILKYYFPNAKKHKDIKKTDFTIYRGRVDVLTGGFPCQPFSNAGKRKGTEDDRSLWPEMLRAIREVQPPFVLAENVPGLLTIERGLVFEQVCADLENEGYEVTPFIIPSAGKDADHLRYRIWIFAYSENFRTGRLSNACGEKRPQDGNELFGECDRLHRNDTYSTKQRLEGSIEADRGQGAQRNDELIDGCGGERNETWLEAATRLCSVDDASAGRLDTKTISKGKWRTESLKAYGNAIYWPVAYELFKAIELFVLSQIKPQS